MIVLVMGLLATVIFAVGAHINSMQKQVLLSNLTKLKFQEIQNAVIKDSSKISSGVFYGFPYAMLSQEDLTYNKVPIFKDGTFNYLSRQYKNIRYQYYLIPIQSNNNTRLAAVYFRIWTYNEWGLVKGSGSLIYQDHYFIVRCVP
ncbi:MAG: hypothetical protein QXJ08_08625 [Sulfolobales archaeon]